MSNKLYHKLFILLIFSVFLWVFSQINTNNNENKQTTQNEIRPDFFFEDFEITTTNLNGDAQYNFNGKNLKHYPQMKQSKFTDGKIVYFTAKGAPWILTSEKGYALDDNSLINLHNKVNIERQKSTHNDYITINTKNTWIYPHKEYLETSEFVDIQTKTSNIKGNGLTANLANNVLQIISNVRGNYEISKK